jgi:hypothetical protein
MAYFRKNRIDDPASGRLSQKVVFADDADKDVLVLLIKKGDELAAMGTVFIYGLATMKMPQMQLVPLTSLPSRRPGINGASYMASKHA